jgi:protein tyrosine/serine phosphatase
MNQPIKNCYWVVENKFLAGEYPWELDEAYSIKKISSLLKAGITCFIDLTHPEDNRKPYQQLVSQLSDYQVKTCRFPIHDYSIPDSDNLTSEILDLIDKTIKENGMVYLHCWGGIGRTGTVVGCWLSRHGYPGKNALQRLHTLWQQCPKSSYRNSPESKEQEQYIINWNDRK